MSKGRIDILIADDEQRSRKDVRDALHELGVLSMADIAEAESAQEVLRSCEERQPDLVFLDLCLDAADTAGETGLQVLHELRGRRPAPEVVVISQLGEEDRLFAAHRLGAERYVIKPVSVEHMRRVLTPLFQGWQARPGRSGWQLPAAPLCPAPVADRPQVPLLGLRQQIEKLARWDTPVLVLGPSGVGKELVAEEIHRLSQRSGDFVPVQLDAMPAELVVAELFGWVKSAHSLAVASRKGLVEHAAGGTLFLDEIGELPLDVQVQLLRLIESRKCRPIGQNQEKEVNFRLVAATNRDLTQMMQEGRFRKDLYYRLAGHTLHVPPLCERLGDLEWLVPRILGRLEQAHNVRVFSVSRAVIQTLCGYSWPGNVRELKHVLQNAIIEAVDEDKEGPVIIAPRHIRFPAEVPIRQPGDAPLAEGLARRQKLEENHDRLEANQIRALWGEDLSDAEVWTVLGIDRSTYYRHLTRLNLKR